MKLFSELLICIGLIIVIVCSLMYASNYFAEVHKNIQFNQTACKDYHSRPVCWYKRHFESEGEVK